MDIFCPEEGCALNLYTPPLLTLMQKAYTVELECKFHNRDVYTKVKL